MERVKLASMQFKEFVWPHNPRVYSIDFRREIALHKLPFGRYQLQNLGQTRRVMQGEGEFVGPFAYRDFKRLASLFYEETPGALIHPIWQSAKAYFVELSLREEPREDYVQYRFAFWECPETTLGPSLSPVSSAGGEGGAVARPETVRYHTVQKGDTLWKIAKDNGTTVAALLQINPQIKNPNLIRVGEQVRLS